MSNTSENIYNEEMNEYIDILFNKKEGAPGRNYLKFRGITRETAEHWKLGYCPVGYLSPLYKSTPYIQKKLHGRLIMPVFDQHGNIATISGRKVFDTLPGPKYDMYPFAARKILFGLYQNKENIRSLNRAVVTEGQLDVITSWQNGFTIATSSFGAHCSLDHLSILARYAEFINILYDKDKAGFEGIKMIQNLSKLCNLKIEYKNPFKMGEDLDSWIKKHSARELFDLLDRKQEDELKDKLSLLKNSIR